jgi:putrescine aminotransferase
MTSVAVQERRERTIDLYSRHVNAGMAMLFKMGGAPVEVSSDGLFVRADDGMEYLDCGGYCVFFLGHGHPVVREAVATQLHRHPVAGRLLPDPLLAEAAAVLARAVPDPLNYVWFGGSGAEAVEAALKIARLGGCGTIIATDDAFHGKTLGALSVSGRARYRNPFEPLIPGVERVPYGDAAAVEERVAAADERCAVIVEPLQSEAGVVVPPSGYLRALRDLCDLHGALLICDEISTGLGRTGHWWHSESEGVVPDLLVAGKALGGGILPASAVVANAAAFEPLNRDPLLHTSTFSGNPLVAAAVTATIGVIKEEDLVRRAQSTGELLLAELRAAAEANAQGLGIEVRGHGLLIGVQLPREHHAAGLLLELMDRNVLVSHSLNAHDVVRITPPALLDVAAREMLVDAFAEAIAAVAESVD